MTSSHAQRTRALLQAEDAAMRAQVQALTHASGWERESALHALTPANSTAVTLSAVLLLHNDWVPQVRQAAAQALARLLPLLDLPQVLGALPALSALQRGRRGSHAPVVQCINAHLQQQLTPDTRQTLLRTVQRGPREAAHFCFDLLLRRALSLHDAQPAQSQAEQLDVLQAGLRTRDLALARRAAQGIRKLPTADARLQAVHVALAAKQVTARIGGLRALEAEQERGTALDTPFQAQVQHALFDRSASVRNLAIRVLGGPSADLLARAWQMLGDTASTPTQQASALILLADLGLPEGRALALQALAHPVAMVRAAAYSAAFRLGADDPDALILRALDDPSNAVFRVVLRLANRLGTRPTRDVLQHGLAHASATRWDRVLALSDTGLWEMLALLLQVPPALTHASQDRQWLDLRVDIALQSLQTCVSGPSASEAAAITARLDQASRVLGAHSSAMRRLLKGFGMPTA